MINDTRKLKTKEFTVIRALRGLFIQEKRLEKGNDIPNNDESWLEIEDEINVDLKGGVNGGVDSNSLTERLFMSFSWCCHDVDSLLESTIALSSLTSASFPSLGVL